MSSILKMAIPMGAVGSAGGAYLIYDHVSKEGESLRDRLVKEYSEKPYKVLASLDDEWTEVKKIYKKSKDKISEVDENQLISWCEDNLKSSEYSDGVYGNVKKWCVIKTSSILQELGSKAISAEDSANNVDSEWNQAWNRYNTDKGKSENAALQIEDAKFKEATEATKGKAAMKVWCGTIYKKQMYHEDAESSLALAMKWCVKPIA
ncbi:hypothetical protein MHF_1445 [Mycoplasma haemofelis Ohio2]|uniref:Uncharacterized protein n=1 Tax=Mycoplasma haemofelis (strain Ohio2) TaxID=859194 RepID=F6FGX0_MYCHI|nr:hypothetical protein MHF_1445 [Mycoplasma haemofelis Ohio2]